MRFAPEDYKIIRMNRAAECTDEKIIKINPDIVKYDRETIDYIVLHQFCHLKYKTHSKGFKEMLNKYMPNYKQYEEKITLLKY